MSRPPSDRSAWRRVALSAAVAGLVAAGVAALAAATRVPRWGAEVRLLISPQTGAIPSERILARALEGLNDGAPEATLSEILRSTALRREVTGDAPSQPVSACTVTAARLGQAHVVTLRVEGPDRQAASGLAAGLADRGVAWLSERFPIYRAERLDPTPAEGPAGPVPYRQGAAAGGLGVLAGALAGAWRERRRRADGS